MNIYHLEFIPEEKDKFFRYIKNIIRSFKSDVNFYVGEAVVERMKKVTYKKRFFQNEEIEKVTFEISSQNNKTTMVDMIIDKQSRKVLEIAYGPLNHKRAAYHPYKQKEASRKFHIV